MNRDLPASPAARPISARPISRPRRPRYSKVPEVTAAFWVIKALTTAFGESTSDYLVHSMAPVAAVLLGGIAFAIALFLQLSTDRYVPRVYWFAVAMVGVFGTMCADALHVGFGVPYLASALFYGLVLAVVFGAWQRTEGTLSIHSIRTQRRELFYWAAVVATFAMGTAVGDLTAVTLGLGYFGSILLFAAVIAIPALGHLRYRMNAILAFWFAYVITRPLGASIADWLGKPSESGGLNLGTGFVSLLLAGMIAVLVAYLGATGSDAPADARAPRRREEQAPPGLVGEARPAPEEA